MTCKSGRGEGRRSLLPGVRLPPGLALSADPFEAARGAELAISVVPTQFLRKVAETFEDALEGAVRDSPAGPVLLRRFAGLLE